MKSSLKILLLILAIFPIWLTIVAWGAESTSLFDVWKSRINAELLKISDRRVQLVDLSVRAQDLSTSPTGTIEVDVSEIRAKGLSPFAVKYFDAQGRMTKIIRLTGKFYIEEEVSVATRVLSRGEVLNEADLKTEWRDISNLRGSRLSRAELVGRTLKSSVAEAEPITDQKIQQETLVARGDRVKILVTGPGLSISGVGIAQEAGSRGQTVKVINPESRKEILGVVREHRVVEVAL